MLLLPSELSLVYELELELDRCYICICIWLELSTSIYIRGKLINTQ